MEFWKTFWSCENAIVHLIHSSPLDAIRMISSIGKKTGYDLRFEISTYRNQIDFGLKTPKYCLIISPNLNRDNIKKCEELAKIGQNQQNNDWMILQYKPYNKGEIYTIHSIYKDIKFNYEDIEYHPMFDVKEQVMDIILFINKDKISHVCKTEDIKNEPRLIPKDITIDSILLASMGEYFLLNKIRHMEIHPSNYKFPNNVSVPRKKLDNIFNDCLFLRKSHDCHICGYYDFNCLLKKIEKDSVYYCYHCHSELSTSTGN